MKSVGKNEQFGAKMRNSNFQNKIPKIKRLPSNF